MGNMQQSFVYNDFRLNGYNLMYKLNCEADFFIPGDS